MAMTMTEPMSMMVTTVCMSSTPAALREEKLSLTASYAAMHKLSRQPCVRRGLEAVG